MNPDALHILIPSYARHDAVLIISSFAHDGVVLNIPLHARTRAVLMPACACLCRAVVDNEDPPGYDQSMRAPVYEDDDRLLQEF